MDFDEISYRDALYYWTRMLDVNDAAVDRYKVEKLNEAE